ncbi:MAG: transposase [Thermodesulfobacteriota bacterium]|nr:transposase [Thermodesulfobacteriota bacterium]
MNKNRQSIRLRKYDYSQAGAYFVTICTQNKKCFFGGITNEKMILNDAGRMINMIWDELPINYPGVNVDEFQIMPNHVHGIIILVGAGPCACPEMTDRIDMDQSQITGQPREINNGQPREINNGQPQEINNGQPQGVAPTAAGLSLSDVVHRFKSLTTARYRHGVKQNQWPPFPGKLWQRNYYEHIVRDENELNDIRRYIMANPRKWDLDRENPNAR